MLCESPVRDERSRGLAERGDNEDGGEDETGVGDAGGGGGRPGQTGK